MVLYASLLLCLAIIPGERVRHYHHFVGGREAGSLEVVFSDSHVTTSNRLRIERMGSFVEQNLSQEFFRNEAGEIVATWALGPATERQKERVQWTPKSPSVLRISSTGKPDQLIPLKPDILLWLPDIDEKMRQAAQGLTPLKLTSFSFATSSVSYLDIKPDYPDPLDEFPDTIRFSGTLLEGASNTQITTWISPTSGQVKQTSSSGGLIVVTQRSELRPPSDSLDTLFEWGLRKLPRIPFLAWRDEIRISGMPDLAETDQQKKVGTGEYLLTRAAQPNEMDAKQLPVKKLQNINKEDVLYLADSPLLGFNDASISGLIARLNPKPGTSRWELACQVNTFVFDFIRQKSLEVGFASAPEVARNPRGDCTEHTVLMVALLRRMGVPARAALGWAGVGTPMHSDEGHIRANPYSSRQMSTVKTEMGFGLHAWVEVKIGKRWIPMDPTFSQAPAGAFRVTTSTSNLNSLAELSWNLGLSIDTVPTVKATPFIMDGSWIFIDDVSIFIQRGEWKLANGRMFIEHTAFGSLLVNDNIRSLPMADAKLIHTRWGTPARYANSLRQLAVDCGRDRWLYFDGLSEEEAVIILGEMDIVLCSRHP